MKDFRDRADRAAERKWKTGFIVVQDEDGRVFVDGSKRNFMDTVEREPTLDDALYMLGTALEEFRMDRVKDVLAQAIRQASTPTKPTGPPSKIMVQGGEEEC